MGEDLKFLFLFLFPPEKIKVMKIQDKHKSKLHKGFEKQVTRQDLKPSIAKVEIVPTILTYSSKRGEYIPLKRKFFNNKWNGINLNRLYSSFNCSRVGAGMYTEITINKEGKYKLSMYGKQILHKKKLKKETEKNLCK